MAAAAASRRASHGALLSTESGENDHHPAPVTEEAKSQIEIEVPPPAPVGVQRTLALIKPDVYPAKKDDIVARIQKEGFAIIKESEVSFDKEKAAEFYKEHLGKGFYEELTTWMSSAPIYALVLEKEDGIKAWRAIAGPTNSNKARETSPESIRALFGTDGSLNAVHGSDSPESAAREIKVVFGEEVSSEPQGVKKPSRPSSVVDAAGKSKPASKPSSKPASKPASRAMSRTASGNVLAKSKAGSKASLAVDAPAPEAN